MELIEKISNNDYHTGKYAGYWSSSNLKVFLESPKKAFYMKHNHKESSPAMELGTLIHEYFECIINGLDFWDLHPILDCINPKTGQSYGLETKAYQEFKEQNPSAINTSQANLIGDIFDVILKDREIKKILSGSAMAEPSIFDSDDNTKIRPDLLKSSAIFDYKTIRPDDFTFDGIIKTIQNRDYDFSASMYQAKEHKRTGTWKKFYWIFITNAYPIDFLIVDSKNFTFDFQDDAVLLNPGALAYEKAMDVYRKCVERNEFPGISAYIKPNWLGQRIFEPMPSGYHNSNIIDYFE